MPAVRATSDSVMADQSRVISRSRIASSTSHAAGPATPRRKEAASQARQYRLERSPARYLYHLEVRFGRSAVRAAPVLGDVVPAGPRLDAVLRPSLSLVVLESALDAAEQFVVTHLFAPTSSKSTFRAPRSLDSTSHRESPATVCRPETLPWHHLGLVVGVIADWALVGGRHCAAPCCASSFSRRRGCRLTLVMSPS